MDKTTILAPDGSVATKDTEYLSLEEVKLLRAYKKFLLARGYQESLRCLRCFESNRESGTRAAVGDNGDIIILCHCRNLFHSGSLY